MTIALVNEQPLIPDRSVSDLQQNLQSLLANYAYTINQLIGGQLNPADFALLAGVGGFTAWANIVHRIAGQNRFRYLNSMASLLRSTTQSIPNGVVTTISFDSEAFDTDGLHEGVTNPSRLTATIAGKYSFACFVQWADNSTGVRYFQVLKNGSSALIKDRRAAANESEGSGAGLVDMTAGDYLELGVFQTSGGALNTAANNVRLSIAYLGE